ncbi:MAG: SPASM domain-containing protein [Candidatus Omnitrophota bacterium]
MKAQLSPFVYKVKGKRNYLLFDSLREMIYSITPEGSPEELEAQLIANELVIQTNGIIPFKYKPNTENYKSSLILRELQLRITEDCQFNCPDCGKIGKGIKTNGAINKDQVEIISRQIGNLIIESLVFIGGNPFIHLDVVEYVKAKINAASYKILVCGSSESTQFEKEKEILSKMGITFSESVCHTGNIIEEGISTDGKNFFFNKELNPCWGNKLAIDSDGEIKPCMWSDIKLGNINCISIPNLILSGKFDEFWEINKDKIEICKDCEYRYLCSDCRVGAVKDSGSLYSKSIGCSYSPDMGTW